MEHTKIAPVFHGSIFSAEITHTITAQSDGAVAGITSFQDTRAANPLTAPFPNLLPCIAGKLLPESNYRRRKAFQGAQSRDHPDYPPGLKASVSSQSLHKSVRGRAQELYFGPE